MSCHHPEAIAAKRVERSGCINSLELSKVDFLLKKVPVQCTDAADAANYI